jgi:hypothetical protein
MTQSVSANFSRRTTKKAEMINRVRCRWALQNLGRKRNCVSVGGNCGEMLPAAQSALPLITSFILQNNVPAAVLTSCWTVSGNKSCRVVIVALVMWIVISANFMFPCATFWTSINFIPLSPFHYQQSC